MIDLPQQSYILIIDDDEEDVFPLKWSLEQAMSKHVVVHIADGAEALEFILARRSVQELPDLILLDINMPGVNGYETLAAMRSADISRTLPVLMFSTSDSPREVHKSYISGANAHLVKPNSIADMKKLTIAIESFWLQSATLPNQIV